MTDNTPKRTRRKPDEPRRCAYIFLEGEEGPAGTRHDIELTDENSYKTSRYCKTHHHRMTVRSRKSGPGRESNLARVKRYREKNPEKVKEWSLARTPRRKQGVPARPTRGRPPKSEVVALDQLVERCAKPPTSRKWHAADERGMSRCRAWKLAGPYEARPLDDPNLCAACRRAIQAEANSAKDA